MWISWWKNGKNKLLSNSRGRGIVPKSVRVGLGGPCSGVGGVEIESVVRRRSGDGRAGGPLRRRTGSASWSEVSPSGDRFGGLEGFRQAGARHAVYSPCQGRGGGLPRGRDLPVGVGALRRSAGRRAT